jgi:hypothetical protein
MGDGLIDVRASRFLRPASRSLRPLEPLRLRRITGALSQAARSGTIYHLWWHPHDFGADPDYSLKFLERVLQHFRHLSQLYGMRSSTMLEVARSWPSSQQPRTAEIRTGRAGTRRVEMPSRGAARSRSARDLIELVPAAAYE